MMKLDAGLITLLPASDPDSAAVWGSKRINSRPQSCLCLTWSGCPSNDDDDDDDERFGLLFILKSHIEGYKYRSLILLLFVFLNIGLILSCHHYFVNNKRNYQIIIIQLTTFIKNFLLVLCYNYCKCRGGKKHFQIEQVR